MEKESSNEKNDNETKLFQCVNNGDFEGLCKLFSKCEFNVDITDEHGMTPLNHAAYKGNKEICQYLIDKGADVNCDKHEHGYRPLHFAVLSGNTDVCHLLLETGAKSHHTNSVGRTAAQMAAFVGNHHCASLINNYVPKSELEYFTVPRGVETTAKLPPKCVLPLHKLIMQINVHPIRIALSLTPQMVEELPSIQKVLNLLRTKEMSKRSENNEVMSFKYHYLAFVIGEITKLSSSDRTTDVVETFVKKILRGSRGDEYLDNLIREAVREFPYRECTLFRQMVTELAELKNSIGSALIVVSSAVNGERYASGDESRCATCSEARPAKRCSKCKQVSYCDRHCQRLHWPVHKKECARDSVDELTTNIDNLTT